MSWWTLRSASFGTILAVFARVAIAGLVQYLRKGITKETLLAETKRMTHFETAQKVFVERQKLFREINSKV